MKKRVLIIPIILVIALLFTACEKERLTEAQYRTQIEQCYKEYTKARENLEQSNPYSGGDSDDFIKAVDRFKAALAAFEELVPPEEIEFYHDKIVSSLSLERQRLEAQKGLALCYSIDDERKYNGEIRKINEDSANLENSYAEVIRIIDIK